MSEIWYREVGLLVRRGESSFGIREKRNHDFEDARTLLELVCDARFCLVPMKRMIPQRGVLYEAQYSRLTILVSRVKECT